MMKPQLDPKESSETKDYGLDWAPQIADLDVTITNSDWEIVTDLGSPDLEVTTHDVDGQRTIVRLDGGEPGRDYTVKNTIVTSTGEHLVDAIEVRVRSVADKAGIY